MKYFIIAGEASGDLHASHLMRELKQLDSKAQFYFLGGDLMAAEAERDPIVHYRDMAFMGFINVLKNSRTVLRNIKLCKTEIVTWQPDALILIDYPSFNLRMARFAKEQLGIPVYYYISPKVWAWKEYRVRSIRKWVDRMFTILPFETEFYQKHNYQVEYVGNPTVDSLSQRPYQKESFETFVSEHGLSEKPIIALLPGSRRQEISSCLPAMLSAASVFDKYQIVVSGAPGVEVKFYSSLIGDSGATLLHDRTYRLLQQAKAAVVNSGTATLETAIIGTPQVVVYQMALARIAMLLKPIFIKTKYVSLPNIIAGREVVRELLGHHFTTANLTNELHQLLNKPTRQKEITEGYTEIHQRLGAPGAARKAAEGVYGLVKK